ncbi:DUF1365 domain-containing protein [Acidisoma sp. C75]
MTPTHPSRSALYPGVVMHRRYLPARHHLRYRIFSLLLDLDEVPHLAARLRFFSKDRFNIVSFYERDHGAGEPGGLMAWVRGQCAAAGIAAPGPVLLLAMPRVFGHAFNPLSLFFCHGADGALAAILYQVNNTFGERHSYLIPVPAAPGPVIRQSAEKVFHVSPFMPMAMQYAFRVLPPGERLSVVIEGRGAAGRMITASLSGRRRPLTDAALLRAVLGAPALGLKVLAGIHWEALFLWRKRVGFFAKPAPPPNPVTFVQR